MTHKTTSGFERDYGRYRCLVTVDKDLSADIQLKSLTTFMVNWCSKHFKRLLVVLSLRTGIVELLRLFWHGL